MWNWPKINAIKSAIKSEKGQYAFVDSLAPLKINDVISPRAIYWIITQKLLVAWRDGSYPHTHVDLNADGKLYEVTSTN